MVLLGPGLGDIGCVSSLSWPKSLHTERGRESLPAGPASEKYQKFFGVPAPIPTSCLLLLLYLLPLCLHHLYCTVAQRKARVLTPYKWPPTLHSARLGTSSHKANPRAFACLVHSTGALDFLSVELSVHGFYYSIATGGE